VDTKLLEVLKAQLFAGLPIRHGFSTRVGGCSIGDYSSLNLSFACGDDLEKVKANRQRYFAAIGSDPERAVFCQQVHGSELLQVSEEHAGKGAWEATSGVAGCDGLYTNIPSVPLNIFTADCVALLFYDPGQRVVGACHAGWPGSAGGIADNVVAQMKGAYGTNPSDLLVAMGPSASACCYEVDDRVITKLEDKLNLTYIRPTATAGKYMVDLREYNALRLQRLGVAVENIERVGGCSICGEQYFSHRRQAGRAGRMLATIELLSM